LENNEILARVGGDWIQISKFIDMFENIEAEKKNIGKKINMHN